MSSTAHRRCCRHSIAPNYSALPTVDEKVKLWRTVEPPPWVHYHNQTATCCSKFDGGPPAWQAPPQERKVGAAKVQESRGLVDTQPVRGAMATHRTCTITQYWLSSPHIW